MTFVLGLLVTLAILTATLYWIARVPAARVAGFLRLGLPGAALAILAVLTVLTRNIAFAGLAVAVAGYLMRAWRSGKPASPAGSTKRSRVRSAALEMELDLDTGEMNGVVLAGRQEGAELDKLDDESLLELYAELSSDPESANLLDAYLDRRMPGWRDASDADDRAGLGTAPGPGAMTEQEAYEVLGLGFGAGKAEISEAHRRLMKRMHPDAGGSAFLAARINEAKAVLLRRHD